MEALKILLPIILKGSIAGVVFAIGLDATRDDVLYFTRRPGHLGRAFLAINIIVPLAAVLVMRALPLSLPAKAGVILMALAPVPPFIPQKELQAGARKEVVYGLFATFALLAVIIVPITVAVLNKLYGTAVELSLIGLVKLVLITVAAPLAVGMIIRARWPEAAARIAPWISKISFLLLVLGAAVIIIRAAPAIIALIGDGMVLGIVVIVVAGIIGGHVLAGPDRRDKAALAATAASRHPGIAMMIANANAPDKKVDASIMLFLIVGMIVVSLYLALMKRAARRTPQGGAPPH